MNNNDIICAPATVPGTGAISVIRVSGKGSLELADKVISLRKGSIAQSKGYTLHFGSIFASDGSLLDEVIVSVFRAPNSYTGEDGVEISCHSSKYIVSETIGLLCEKGCRMAGPGEFTQRAYLNGKMDLAQAEAVADVIAADSKAALRVAQSQLRGEYSAAFKELRDALVRLSALVELELDFSEEEVEFASREMIRVMLDCGNLHCGAWFPVCPIGKGEYTIDDGCHDQDGPNNKWKEVGLEPLLEFRIFLTYP